jgi:hypothetical protein
MDDEMVSSAGGGIADPLARQCALTVQTFHAYLFFRVRQSGPHCSGLGRYVVMIAK